MTSTTKKFNFSFAPKEQFIVGDKQKSKDTFYIELPKYNDLLAKEYLEVEKLDTIEAEWTNELISLANQIAIDKEMPIWDVVNDLTQLGVKASSASKFDYLAPYLKSITRLVANKLQPKERQMKLILCMLQTRVSPDITQETLELIPNQYLQELSDFFFQEQTHQSNRPYSAILADLEANTELLEYAEAAVEELQAQSKSEVVEGTALAKYLAFKKVMGKST